MIVADTSYIVEAILRNANLIENETLVTPDLALYETVNALWKHEVLIGDLEDPSLFLGLLLELITTGVIQLVRPDEKLLRQTYAISVKHRMPIYDAVFVALALELGLELKTFDNAQINILSKERNIAANEPPQ